MALQSELKEKNRVCYNLQLQLSEAQAQVAIQEKVISKEAGAQQALAQAMLQR